MSKLAVAEHTLAAGAETLDLTAIINQAGTLVDFAGLKVPFIHIKVKAANTATIKFKTGATSGYNLLLVSRWRNFARLERDTYVRR